MPLYDPNAVARYFDAFGEREWERLVQTPAEEVKLHVHAAILREHVSAGMRVLDIGAGAGRFTQILGELGASIVVADISEGQLALNQKYAKELGFEAAVTAWKRLDICDLSALEDASFDAVVCYGGPLSYVFEWRAQAVLELRRVLKPGGHLLLSVMSLWGTVHQALPGVLRIDREQNARIIESGDLHFGPDDDTRHHCHLYRSEELRALIAAGGFETLLLSASNCVSTAWGELLRDVRSDAARWDELLGMEREACREPGCLDMGTHLIAVARRPA